jgi:hypothetical protein
MAARLHRDCRSSACDEEGPKSELWSRRLAYAASAGMIRTLSLILMSTLRHFSKVLVLGMAATILAGVAQHALGYPTPKPVPGTELTATSSQQTVTRKVVRPPLYLRCSLVIDDLQAYMAVTLLQTAALTFIKLSCMFFYRRIFCRTGSQVANIAIYIIMALIVIWSVGFFFSFLFACGTHFNYFWTDLENQLKCPADLSQIDLSLSISDVIMDVIILVFPIPWVGCRTVRGISRC